MFRILHKLQHSVFGYSELTSEENELLKKRGFFVKEFVSYGELFSSILIHFYLTFPVTIIGMIIGFPIWILFQTFNLALFSISFSFIFFIISMLCYTLIGKLFYIDNGIILHGMRYTVESDSFIFRYIYWMKSRFFINATISLREWLSRSITYLFSLGDQPIAHKVTGPRSRLSIFLQYILFYFYIFIFLLGSSIGFVNAWKGFLFFPGLFILVTTFFYFIRQLIERFHPLYAFGNIGEKIQSLTPEIEQQSKEIQENFKEDMNFSFLHSGFEKLSSTFSQIVSLVLNLENIEKKANKGNPFDSTKYINSLRSDILTPLISLRTFLDKQKIELMNSQKELSRVRVGGSEEDTSNRELASKRSESLMIELEKNIVSLDEMIEKMG